MDIGLARVVDGEALRQVLADLLPGSRIAVVDSVMALPVDADACVVRQIVPAPSRPDDGALAFPMGLMVQARLADGVDPEAWLSELARQLSRQLGIATLFDTSDNGGRPGQWLVWHDDVATLVEEHDNGHFVPVRGIQRIPDHAPLSISLAEAVQQRSSVPALYAPGKLPAWYRVALLVVLLWSLVLLSGYSLGEIVLGAASLVRDATSASDATRLFAAYATSALTAIPAMLAGAAGLTGSIALLARRRWSWLPMLLGTVAIAWPLLVWFVAWAFWRAADDLGATLLLVQILLSAVTLFGLPVLWLLARRRGWLSPG